MGGGDKGGKKGLEGRERIDTVKAGQFYKEPRPFEQLIAETEAAMALQDTQGRIDAAYKREGVLRDDQIKMVLLALMQPLVPLGNYIEAKKKDDNMGFGHDFWALVDEIKIGSIAQMLVDYGGNVNYKLEVTKPAIQKLLDDVDMLLAEIVAARAGRDLDRLDQKTTALKQLLARVNPLGHM